MNASTRIAITVPGLIPEGISQQFWEHFRLGEYAKIVTLTPQSYADTYLLLRSTLIQIDRTHLGHWEAQWQQQSPPAAWQKLYQAVRLLYVNNAPTEARALLEELAAEPTTNVFFAGELAFHLGFAWSLEDQFSRSLSFYFRSADAFRALDMPGPLSVSLFNLCVCYNHLNEQDLFAIYYQQLQALHQWQACPTVEVHYLRLRAYRLIDAQEYRAALEVMPSLIALCQKTRRFLDLGSLYSALIFLHLKKSDEASCRTVLNEALGLPLSPSHTELLLQWRNLIDCPFLKRSQLDSLLKRWGRLGMTSVNRLFLMNILAQKMLRSGEYSTTLWLCRQAKEFSLKKQQHLGLLDFRSLELECLLRLGKVGAAKEIFQILSHQKHPDCGDECRARLYQLQHLISEAPADQTETHDRLMTCDWVTNEIMWKGHPLDVSSFPLLREFLFCLAESGRMEDLSKVYESLYHQEYHPLRHEHRIQSLIARARKIFGESQVIRRAGGKVGFDPSVKVQCTPLTGNRKNRALEKRYGVLLKVFKESRSALAISDLEDSFSCTRRTLQADLKQLVNSGLLQVQGGGRLRSYRLKEVSV